MEAHKPTVATRPRLLTAVAAALTLVLGLLGAARATSGRTLWSPDMGPRFAQLKQFATSGSFLYLDNPDVLADPHARFFQLGDIYAVTVPKGLATVYSPIYPALAYLPHRFGGLFGVAVLSALGLVVATLGVSSLLTALRFRAPIAGALTFALATAVFSYGTMVWDHSIHIAIVAAAFALLARSYLQPRFAHPLAAAMGGALLGAGLYFHILFAILGCCWAAAALALGRGQRRLLIQFVVAFGLVAVTWVGFNMWAYGAPFGPQTMGANSLARHENQRLLFDLHEVAKRVTDQTVGEGALRWRRLALVALAGAAGVGLVRARAAPLGVVLVVGGVAGYLVVDNVYWSTGLLTTSPLLLAALPFPLAVRSADDERAPTVQFRRMLWLATALFLGATLLQPRSPGLNWGSRYLLLTAPALVALGLTSVEDALARVGNRLARLLLLAGVAATLVAGGVGNWRSTERLHTHQVAMREDLNHVHAADARVLVTDLFWLASYLEAEPHAPHVFHVGELEDLATAVPSLYDVLEKLGHRTFVVRASPRFAEIMANVGRERQQPCTVRNEEDIPGLAHYTFFECAEH